MHTEPSDNQPTSTLENVIPIWLETQFEQLHDQARMLVDDYWRQLQNRHKQGARNERGRIGVRIRRRDSSLSFSIEWYRMASLRQNGATKPICQYLKKGLGYRYPLQKILKGEPDWEQTLVEELENEFVDIRKQLALLGKIRDGYHQFQQATQEGNR
ncbi:conjugative transfer protein MobI(A/C) [Methylomonas sp. EFPC3]|uniref:conjugative transfer protein MobI(A/C) n=1 Tax=Methylomonas sp. EFPC3 TaxID=3021710 RepID=UPI002417B57F|nr:conjugative transfer protein MobI(A/C) [Methylomonas sp. EFPC3]WFP50413.1 conjugative transfer protein MobI(A/C) [Methylomonas sp. EFPC3]